MAHGAPLAAQNLPKQERRAVVSRAARWPSRTCLHAMPSYSKVQQTREGSNPATHRAAVAGVRHVQCVADAQRAHRGGAVALAAAKEEGQGGVSGG